MPLTFDFPYDTLLTYGGRNPCPVDFNAFWKRANDEMEAIDPVIEMIPSPFKPPAGKNGAKPFAECFDLYFTGIGQARVHAKLVRPKGEAASRAVGAHGKGPALLQFHGYTGNCGDWQSKLAWAAAGFTVAALDCRGQGGLSEDNSIVRGNTHQGHIIRGLEDALAGNPDKMLYRSIFMDTARLARIVMALDGIDPDRIGATGGSQGGALTCACAALEPRIARAAPVYPFLSDYKRVWEMDLAKDAYCELREWFRKYDPRHEKENEVFSALGYIDIQHLAPRISAEVLMTVGLMDTICPPSTQFAAYNRIPGKKALSVYPDFGHEYLPDCDDIIMNFFASL